MRLALEAFQLTSVTSPSIYPPLQLAGPVQDRPARGKDPVVPRGRTRIRPASNWPFWGLEWSEDRPIRVGRHVIHVRAPLQFCISKMKKTHEQTNLKIKNLHNNTKL